jgi:hypothetical protein
MLKIVLKNLELVAQEQALLARVLDIVLDNISSQYTEGAFIKTHALQLSEPVHKHLFCLARSRKVDMKAVHVGVPFDPPLDCNVKLVG